MSTLRQRFRDPNLALENILTVVGSIGALGAACIVVGLLSR